MKWIFIFVGFIAGFLSSSVGFGGGMILLPVITSVYGVEVAVPVSTIAQLISNASRVCFGIKEVEWRKAGQFLLLAAPLTALGALGFAVVPKVAMTRVLCVFLIVFAILKLGGKISLPKSNIVVIAGGGVTGVINGLLGISGPLSSAVFLTLGLTPVAYIVTEATAAVVMHVIKIVVYGKLNLVSYDIFLNGLFIGASMMLGNYLAIHTIKHINKKRYQKIVAIVMVVVSLWLFYAVK